MAEQAPRPQPPPVTSPAALARLAFEAYHTKPGSPTGERYDGPTWRQLTPTQRKRWALVGEVVADAARGTGLYGWVINR